MCVLTVNYKYLSRSQLPLDISDPKAKQLQSVYRQQ